jgi:hypothetical protein
MASGLCLIGWQYVMAGIVVGMLFSLIRRMVYLAISFRFIQFSQDLQHRNRTVEAKGSLAPMGTKHRGLNRKTQKLRMSLELRL